MFPLAVSNSIIDSQSCVTGTAVLLQRRMNKEREKGIFTWYQCHIYLLSAQHHLIARINQCVKEEW